MEKSKIFFIFKKQYLYLCTILEESFLFFIFKSFLSIKFTRRVPLLTNMVSYKKDQGSDYSFNYFV